MKIRFLFGYCGRETAMKAYNEGEHVEMNHDAALTLVNHGIAEEVTEFKLEPLPDEKPKLKLNKKARHYDPNA
jgi:hypothetical protein